MLLIARNFYGVLLLLFVSFQAYATEYNSLLLRAQVGIFPKIIMLDTDIGEKVNGNQINLHVVHKADDKKHAQKVKRLIDERYGNKIGVYELNVDVVEAGLKTINTPTAYFVMDVSDDEFSKVSSIAMKNNRICFSYNYKDIESNSLISLQLKEKMYIYLSKQQLNRYDIRFQSVFYNIVKVVK